MGSIKRPFVGKRGIDGLEEDDVAVGKRELGFQHPKEQGQFENENTVIKPTYSFTHWAIKFGSHYYQLVRTKDNKIEIEMITELNDKKSFSWQKMGKNAVRGSQIIQLIEEINERNLSYDLLKKNCQHFAAAIGNYAMGEWDRQKALEYFVD